MLRRLLEWGSGIWIVVFLATTAMATPPNTELLCPDDTVDLSPHRYLRAVSFDLRGKPPTASEAGTFQEGDGDASVETLIDRWLYDDAFPQQVVRRHRNYLWNNISNTSLINRSSEIQAQNGIWWARIRADRYRPSEIRRPHCGNFEAEFDEDGRPITRINEAGSPQEGYVMVNPYWAPETTIQVCAYEGNPVEVTADGVACDSPAGLSEVDCGCGPNLVFCAPNFVRNQIKRGMGQSIELMVEAVIGDGEPYTNLFESRRFFVNGPMVHFYRYLSRSAQAQFSPSPVNVDLLPDLAAYEVDTWVEMKVGQEHAGVLTHPAFLMRFQTNRARASTFYQAFLCSPFQPPAAGLPPADAEAARNPDLQERAGCKYCHSGLEPAAAHWGRWSEEGGGFISARDFPAEDPECVACAQRTGPCTPRCRTYYLTRSLGEQEQPYLGMLKSFVFRRDEHMHHIDLGPKLLARAAIADNRLPRCTAQQTASWLLGRSLDRPGDAQWLTDLSIEFVRSGFDYRALVKAIITSDRYRRVQ